MKAPAWTIFSIVALWFTFVLAMGTAYLDNPNRSVEVDADNFISAQRQAAMLFGTRREHDVYLIACPQVKYTTAEFIADTEGL